MADPIKTTVQEALDHIKEWTTKGEKDKAVRGLQEILHFDPSNADAQKMLSELQAAPPAVPSAGAFKLDMELKPMQPTAAAPVPVPTPAPVGAVPTSTPVAPPKPATPPPAPAPMPVGPTLIPPKPIAPQPTAPTVPTPIPASPLKPLSSPPPAPSTQTPTSSMPPASMMNKVQGMSQNVKWVIFAGALLIAVIGGYLFYKNVLSTSEPITSDIQQQVENSSSAASTDTPSDAASSTLSDTPTPTDTSAATDAATTIPTTPSSDLTPAATDPAAVTPPVSPATTSPAASTPAPQPVGEKVKRR